MSVRSRLTAILGGPPELMVALLRSRIHTMITAFVEAMGEEERAS